MTDIGRHRPHPGGPKPWGLPTYPPKMMRPLRHPALSWILLIGYALLLFIQSSFPSLDMGPELPGMDKLLHLVAYAVMGVLACRAFATLPRLRRVGVLFLAGLLFTFLFGISDEWHQSFVPGRMADGWDLVADGLGGLLGAGLYTWRRRSVGGQGWTFPR